MPQPNTSTERNSAVWLMLDSGRPISEIARSVGMPRAEVERLKSLRIFAGNVLTFDRTVPVPERDLPDVSIPPEPERVAKFGPEVLALLRRWHAIGAIGVEARDTAAEDALWSDTDVLLAQVERRLRR